MATLRQNKRNRKYYKKNKEKLRIKSLIRYYEKRIEKLRCDLNKIKDKELNKIIRWVLILIALVFLLLVIIDLKERSKDLPKLCEEFCSEQSKFKFEEEGSCYCYDNNEIVLYTSYVWEIPW